jgi:hypothetical protein
VNSVLCMFQKKAVSDVGLRMSSQMRTTVLLTHRTQ